MSYKKYINKSTSILGSISVCLILLIAYKINIYLILPLFILPWFHKNKRIAIAIFGAALLILMVLFFVKKNKHDYNLLVFIDLKTKQSKTSNSQKVVEAIEANKPNNVDMMLSNLKDSSHIFCYFFVPRPDSQKNIALDDINICKYVIVSKIPYFIIDNKCYKYKFCMIYDHITLYEIVLDPVAKKLYEKHLNDNNFMDFKNSFASYNKTLCALVFNFVNIKRDCGFYENINISAKDVVNFIYTDILFNDKEYYIYLESTGFRCKDGIVNISIQNQ